VIHPVQGVQRKKRLKEIQCHLCQQSEDTIKKQQK